MRPGQGPPLPAVRAAIGEEFGLPAGNLVTNEMVSGLRRLGFDRVFDTDFAAVRGMEGVKAASIPVGDVELKVAVGHGLANVRKILEQIRSGERDYHFVEMMCCPGGCLGGGGQPIPTDADIRGKRAEALYEADRLLPLRKSHENPSIKRLYEEFLGEPLGHKSHELLHTSYTPRKRWLDEIEESRELSGATADAGQSGER